MKLIIKNKNDYIFEMTNNYKLFQNLITKKSILKKSKFKKELTNYFNEIKKIANDKKISENYLLLKKGLKKYKFNLDNINLHNFISVIEETIIDDFKKIDKNMF